MIKRDLLIKLMNFGLVFVGVVTLMSMADVNLVSMTERDLVMVLGGILTLILYPIICFIFRKKVNEVKEDD